MLLNRRKGAESGVDLHNDYFLSVEKDNMKFEGKWMVLGKKKNSS